MSADLATQTDTDTDAGDDADLGDELFRVAEDTEPDGRVRVEIREVEKIGYASADSEIAVTARRPSMREFTEQMPYPERDDPEYKFVRLCREAGYTLSSVEQLEGATVLAENDGGWSLYAPPESTTRDKVETVGKYMLGAGGFTVSIAALPVILGVMMLFDDDEPGGDFDTHGEMVSIWMFATVGWLCGVLIVALFLGGVR